MLLFLRPMPSDMLFFLFCFRRYSAVLRCSAPRGIPRAICLRLLARHLMPVPAISVRGVLCPAPPLPELPPCGVLCAHLAEFREREDYVPDKERELRYSPS